MKRIGILGGTFDPVHNGHLLLGTQAYREYGLDEVWFMPSHIPAYKKDHKIADGADRLAMLRLAVEGLPHCVVSDFEMRREGNTYTSQTMALLRSEYPDVRFYFIIGADSLYELETWHEPETVMRLTSFLVSGREYAGAVRSLDGQIRYLRETYGADISLLHNEEVDIASVELRRRVAVGESIERDVPKRVADYIAAHGLYCRA